MEEPSVPRGPILTILLLLLLCVQRETEDMTSWPLQKAAKNGIAREAHTSAAETLGPHLKVSTQRLKTVLQDHVAS